jgi:hypothetical protein
VLTHDQRGNEGNGTYKFLKNAGYPSTDVAVNMIHYGSINGLPAHTPTDVMPAYEIFLMI